ncbi:hypothetical protein C2W62_03590 [Candidatus Entotheonella serta]|nr:hypothetical protein C2W62_03590 [Candidatus Entotheonella serta]
MSGLLPRLKAMQVLDEGDMALLQRFLSVSGLDDHTSSLDEVKQHQIQFRLALSRGIMALAQRQPMMLVMEDLHMADQPSLDVFVDMALAFATHQPVPLLLVGSYQPVVSEKDELTRALNKLLPEKMVHALQLAGLQEAETRELLQQLGVARPTQHLVQTLQDWTHGIPLCIEQAVHHAVSTCALLRGRLECR